MQKLSVITVNRNNANGLEQTIKSVIDQTYQNIEYIIIDGASTDSSPEIIEKYSEYLSYWVSEPDEGIYNAMNKGIEKVSGDYVIFMNSGDCFFSEHTVTNIFSQKKDSDFILGRVVSVGKYAKVKSELFPSNITFYNLYTYPIPHQATFVKKEVFTDFGGFDEKLKICSDWKFVIIAVAKHERNMLLIDEFVALVDASEGESVSAESSALIKREKEEILRTHFAPFYEDYQELYRRKKYSWPRISRYVRWRMNQLFIHKK